MSGIELIRTLERIKNMDLPREERLKAIVSLRNFDIPIIEPNIKVIILTMTELAKRVEGGQSEELEFFGVMLIQLSKIITLLPKHAKKVFNLIKLITRKFPRVMTGFGIVSFLISLENFFKAENELVFDDAVKDIIVKTILKGTNIKLRARALETLFIALWNVPWALNEYMDIIKAIIDNPNDPLFDQLFEYLSIVAKKSFYTIRPILDGIFKKHADILEMPPSILYFLTNVVVPMRETDYLRMMKDILSDIALRHQNNKIRGSAIINLANIFRHPKFVEEKKHLLQLIDSITAMEDDIDISIACLRALATCIWSKDAMPSRELIERISSIYYNIQDISKKKSFIDSLLQVYSNIPEVSDVIIAFAIKAIYLERENFEILVELQKMLSTIVSTEININTLRVFLRKLLELMKLPEEKLGVALRTMFLENIIVPLAKRAPDLIVEQADELIDVYNRTPGPTVFDDIAKIIFETLRRHSDKNENCVKLLNLLMNPPDLGSSYEDILKYLIGLAKRYQDEIAKNSDFVIDVFRTIKEIEVTITDPLEKYFAVDEAIKNLARLIVLIMPSISPEDYDTFAKTLATMYATERGDALRDILYAIIRTRDYPELHSYVKNYLSKLTLTDTHIDLLKRVRIFQ